MKRAIALVIAIILILGGITTFIVGAVRSGKMSETTTGEIVSYVIDETYDSDTGTSISYYPVYKFEVRGQVYEKQSPVGHGKPKYEVGDEVTIKYNPLNPNMSIIKGASGFGFLGIVLIVLGLFIGFIGLRRR